MKFKHGDHVRFLNDTGGGTVNRVDDKGFVYVLTDDGFEIPVSEKELLLARNLAYADQQTEPEEKKAVQKTSNPVNTSKAKPEPITPLPENIPVDSKAHILLGFVPENSGPVFSNRIACYLVNDSPFFLYFMAGKKEGGSMAYLTSGNVEPDTKVHIKSFDQTTLSKMSDLHFQIIFVSKGRYVSKEPIDKLLNLNLVNFNKESYFHDNDYFNEKAVLYNLTGKTVQEISKIKVPDSIKELKMNADAAQPIRQKKKEPEQDTLEIDLHFDGEGLQNSQLSPAAILALQMSRFHSAVEEAISKNLHRLVIIHGLGQGTLKMQIRKELQEKYPAFIYQDASFKEYGFGATMVHITFDKKQ